MADEGNGKRGGNVSIESEVAAGYPQVLKQVFDAFWSSGVEAYLIGPRAREIAGGADISNARSFDLTVNASMTSIETTFAELFGVAPKEHKDERPKLLTFKVPMPGREQEGSGTHWTFNVGPFRNYLPPLQSLRSAKLSGIILDLATREIPIQAFAYDAEGNLIDPFGGTKDLEERLVRPVFPTETVFRESSGWLLKVARYVSRYGFPAARQVGSAASRDAVGILDVPRDIWRREMDKMLMGNHPDMGLQFLADTRVLGMILPEVAVLVSFLPDEEGRHKDVWEHTKQVVVNADKDLVVRWAALCHDIGKVWTRRYFSREKVHFFRHEDMGAMLFEGIALRFRMDHEFAENVRYIIKNHSRINLYREEWTDSAVRRLVRDVGDHLDRLIAFSRADLTSKRAGKVERIRSLLADLQDRIAGVKEEAEAVKPLPKGVGNRIMEHFGLEPGPAVGRMRKALIQAVQEGTLPSQADHDVYIRFLEQWLTDDG